MQPNDVPGAAAAKSTGLARSLASVKSKRAAESAQYSANLARIKQRYEKRKAAAKTAAGLATAKRLRDEQRANAKAKHQLKMELIRAQADVARAKAQASREKRAASASKSKAPRKRVSKTGPAKTPDDWPGPRGVPREGQKSRSGFFYYNGERFPVLRAEMPSAKVTEITKRTGAEWRAMSPEQKAKYNEMAKMYGAKHKPTRKAPLPPPPPPVLPAPPRNLPRITGAVVLPPPAVLPPPGQLRKRG